MVTSGHLHTVVITSGHLHAVMITSSHPHAVMITSDHPHTSVITSGHTHKVVVLCKGTDFRSIRSSSYVLRDDESFRRALCFGVLLPVYPVIHRQQNPLQRGEDHII